MFRVVGDDLRWYAVAVHARQERAAAVGLRQRGYEVFLPLRAERRMWSDRIKEIERPLFTGYLFARAELDAKRRIDMLQVRQVRDLLGRNPRDGRLAEPIPDAEIESLRRVAASGRELAPVEGLVRGTEVLIGQGPLRGARGVVVCAPDGERRLTVQITLLGRGVRIALGAEDVLAGRAAGAAS